MFAPKCLTVRLFFKHLEAELKERKEEERRRIYYVQLVGLLMSNSFYFEINLLFLFSNITESIIPFQYSYVQTALSHFGK